jgi:hypothetical protein
MAPLACWHLPCIFMSSVGVLNQPGYWPSGYILASRVFLVLLTAFLGFKALFWPFRFIEEK